MKSRVWLFLLLPLLFTLFSFQTMDKEPVGKITFPLNRVFVIRAGSSNLMIATFNMDVFPGDKIETKKESRCEITLKNGDVVRIDENSIYTLEEVQVGEESVKAESFLNVGKLWSNIRKLFSKDDYFRVKSPSAVIAVRGTIYRVGANPDSTVAVRVYDGEVQVSPNQPGMGVAQPAVPPGQGTGQLQQPTQISAPTQVSPPTQVQGPTEVSVETWMEIVKAQQQILVRPDGTFQKSEFDMEEDARSDWVQWNRRRDEMLQR